MKDAQYLLSIIYHNLDMEIEGNEVATRCSQTEQLQQNMEKAIVDEEIREIFDLVATIGAALAGR
jgi:proteasome assembly chaperone (PAC2) family protein